MSVFIFRLLRVLCSALIWLSLIAASASAADLKTRNVVLITTDGLRWQEVFTGADQTLMNKLHGGVSDVETTRATFWRDSSEERRAVLLPFFWNKIAKDGQIYGNRSKGSSSQITNSMRFS